MPQLSSNFNTRDRALPPEARPTHIRRPSLTNIRARTSPLKFFASSTPKIESQRDSHRMWEKEYLNDLRSNRPSRPLGSRPLPDRNLHREAPIPENPQRIASAISRPLFPMRKSSPSKMVGEGRCSSALSRQQETLSTPDADPSNNEHEDTLDSDDEERSLVQTKQIRPREVVPSSRLSSGIYKERGQRLVEKEEARMLREALEAMDMREEARLHSAAQDEASELVFKHKYPGLPYRNPDAYYSHRNQSGDGVHTTSQSDAPVAGVPHPLAVECKDARLYQSSRTSSGGPKSSASNRDIGEEPRSNYSISNQKDISSKNVNSSAAQDISSKSQPELSHAFWDSPGKRAYMNLTFTIPEVKKSGRRRSSGSKSRNVSGSLFRNPDDKIYEEPEELKNESNNMSNGQVDETAPLKVTTRNPVPKIQAIDKPSMRSMTDPVDKRERIHRTEIHRNTPSQSRNPSYIKNDLPARPDGLGTNEFGLPAARSGRRNGVDVRSDDIRAATSMRLRDRSPKLPSPTVVSDSPGRPIVSFHKNWTPGTLDLKREEKPENNAPSQNAQRDSRTMPSSKPLPPESTISAPKIPTIDLPDSPKIYVEGDPAVPSIGISSVPSVSIRTADVPVISVSEPQQKPLRPLPNPDSKPASNVKTRPFPHHSSSAPITKSAPHWSPSIRRATAQCAACALPISGRVVSAATERFHPECFTCFQCSEQLECVAFYPEPDNFRDERLARIRARINGVEVPDEQGKTWEDDGDESLRFYCHLDFHEKFSPRCRSCKTPIEGEVVVACGGEWHVGHFFCAQCGDPFDPKTPFVEKDGYAWCVGCHTNRFSGKCRGCKKPVVDLVVRALGGEWHEKCFCCKVCLIDHYNWARRGVS